MKYHKFIFIGHPITKSNEKIMGKQGRFFLSRKYKDYERTLQEQFLSQRPNNFKMFCGKIKIWLFLYFKDNRRRDVQNYPKSILDAFNGFIYKDDSQVYEIHIYKRIDKKNPRVEMEVIEYEK